MRAQRKRKVRKDDGYEAKGAYPFLYTRRVAFLVYKNPPGEHTAAYNVDVANCDRNSIVLYNL